MKTKETQYPNHHSVLLISSINSLHNIISFGIFPSIPNPKTNLLPLMTPAINAFGYYFSLAALIFRSDSTFFEMKYTFYNEMPLILRNCLWISEALISKYIGSFYLTVLFSFTLHKTRPSSVNTN
jgi:hypothetical protein